MHWFDLCVDTFFITDLLCRAFLFGYTDESSKAAWGGMSGNSVLLPDKVTFLPPILQCCRMN